MSFRPCSDPQTLGEPTHTSKSLLEMEEDTQNMLSASSTVDSRAEALKTLDEAEWTWVSLNNQLLFER
jgi:hypothetical protein